VKDSEENYVYLINKIDGFIRKYYLNRVIKGSIFLVCSLLVAFILVTTAEYLGRFDPTIRSILFYSFIAGNFFVITAYLLFPLLSYFRLGKTLSHEQASAIIGQHFTPIKDKLLNTLQLKRLADSNPEQRSLIEASINQKIAELRPVPFTSAIHIKDNRKYLKYAIAPLAVIVFIFFASPSILSESTERLINHNKRFIIKAPFNFEILNKNLSAVQGSDYTLKVKLSGNEIPSELYLEDGVNTFKLNKENIIQFSYTFKNLQKSKKLRLRGGEFSSKDYLLEVKEKPSIINFKVFIEYPAYLNKKNEVFENSGDISIPEGSRINWKFNSQNCKQLQLKIDSKNFLLNVTEESVFNFTHRATKSSIYSFKPINKDVQSADEVSYQLKVIPDLTPAIKVNEIQDSLNNKLLYFMGQINDDHGFSKLTFNYRLLSKDLENSVKPFIQSVKFDKTELQSNFIHTWNATEAGAGPGEQIEYYFEVFDNDGVNGPKASRSDIKILQILSEKELDEQLDKNTEQIKDKMEQAIKKSIQVDKEAKKLNQELLNKKNISYEEKKQIESLLQKQRELEELVKEVQQENKQNQFEQNEQNEQILEKQKQIENLFNNVLDEKTREILKNIEKLLDKNNNNQTREELSKMQMDNKSLQKELDRILELYKQLEFDQKLSEAIEKLDDLAKDQESLSEKSLDKNADISKLKNEQNVLKEEFKALESELNKLEQKNEELEQKNNFENPEKDQNQIEQQQKESSENLEKKDQKKAAQNQKQAASKMKELSKKLETMKEEGEEEESEVNAKELREVLDNLIISSFDQEKTMQKVRGISTNDPEYVVQTQKQKDIQINLKMIEDSLYSLSKRVPQIQSVVNKEIQTINLNVKNAIENLGERRTAEANRSQQFAMTSINNLALMLNEALEQLQQSQQNSKPGGKGKKKQSLSQLSKMQEQLNKNMQKARDEMQKQGQQAPGKQGNRPGSMSEGLAKMAREQQMIRQAIQELNKLENKDGKGGLGNLDKLVKEMEQTETDLVNKRIKQETLTRQQDILSKLLEADKADREREEDQKRESKQGVNQPPINSLILQDYFKIKQKETDLLKTVTPSLNPFYKIKVGEYFKFLNSGYK
jgi:hypothetical protein